MYLPERERPIPRGRRKGSEGTISEPNKTPGEPRDVAAEDKGEFIIHQKEEWKLEGTRWGKEGKRKVSGKEIGRRSGLFVFPSKNLKQKRERRGKSHGG